MPVIDPSISFDPRNMPQATIIGTTDMTTIMVMIMIMTSTRIETAITTTMTEPVLAPRCRQHQSACRPVLKRMLSFVAGTGGGVDSSMTS